MEYREIQINAWNRREYFEHYTAAAPCTYSMTVKLDVTPLRQPQDKLYPAMLYLLTKTVNRFEPFRTAYRPDGTLVVYQEMHPSYTIFHRETESFSSIWTEFSAEYPEFLRRYQTDVQLYEQASGFSPKPNVPENSFHVSMIPWTAFESFQLNLPDFRYLLPIFTMGKYTVLPEGRCLLPLAVQAHHAVCDGYHLGRFLDCLQQQLNAWPGETQEEPTC